MTIIGLFIGLFISIFIIYQKAPEWALNEQCQTGGFNLDNIEDQFSFDFVKCFWFEYLPSIVVTMANIAGPMMIFYLISYEKYEENTALLLSLGWCIFLRWEARRVYLLRGVKGQIFVGTGSRLLLVFSVVDLAYSWQLCPNNIHTLITLFTNYCLWTELYSELFPNDGLALAFLVLWCK